MTRFGLSTTVFGAAPLSARECDLAASHGFNLIEIAARPGHFDWRDAAAIRDVRTFVASAGLEIASLSVSLIDASAGLAAAADLGSPLLIARADGCRAHNVGPRALANTHEFRRTVDTLAEQAVASGVGAVVEMPLSMGAEQMVDLLDSLESAPVGVCLDVGHAQLTSGAPEAIEILSGFIVTTHLSDNTGREDQHRPPYAGSVDWPATLMAFWKTGYTGPAVFELTADPDVTTTLARAVSARTRLQAILDDLAQPMVFPE
jgi:sugar phosphate isomerase/epimerase